MATIPVNNDGKIYQIQKFLGLHESSDGDTQIKMGESPAMVNWQVTTQGHLRTRPGAKAIHTFSGPVRGLWAGHIGGRARVLCAADGGVWSIEDGNLERIGDIWDDWTTFFVFGGKVYILNGHEYMKWDGEGYVDTVDGYIPIVVTAAEPASGAGTTLENPNLLTGKRRVRYVSDGETVAYLLPAGNTLASVDKVTIDGAVVSGYTVNKTARTVTFTTAPAEGSNNVEITYTELTPDRAKIEAMRFSEMFNGANDSRVFVYGDGSAKAYYCGIPFDSGIPSAEYFPDLYEMMVGDSTTPITAMIKHYDKLLTFKPDGTFSTAAGTMTLEDGTVIPAFTTNTMNREVGNEPMGQVRLVYNYPRSIHDGSIYDWTISSVRDERNSKLASQRVAESMQEADVDSVFTFDDDMLHEYYIFLNDAAGNVLVHNYITDIWYKYDRLPARCACRAGKTVYLGFTNGKLCTFSHENKADDDSAILTKWESGNMDFGSDYLRKHSSLVWVSLKPAENARVFVTAKSDRRSEYAEKEVFCNTANFWHVNFNHFSFETNHRPKMRRVKLKVKKFAFYKLIIRSEVPNGEATVLGIDMRVRFTGYVK